MSDRDSIGDNTDAAEHGTPGFDVPVLRVFEVWTFKPRHRLLSSKIKPFVHEGGNCVE